MVEPKLLPVHSLAQLLNKNLVDVPLGNPSFRDKRYNSHDLDVDFFSPLVPLENNGKMAFVDGGNAVLVSAPNFAVGFHGCILVCLKEIKS